MSHDLAHCSAIGLRFAVKTYGTRKSKADSTSVEAALTPLSVCVTRILRVEEKGFVLLSVLIITAIISALALGTVISTRARLQVTNAELQTLTARNLADAGLTRVIAALETPGDPLFADLRHSPVSWSYAERKILLSLAPEAGKIDLNTGHPDLIRAVMLAVVKDESRANGILNRWAKWRRRGHDIEAVDLLLDPQDWFTEHATKLETFFTTVSGARGIDPLVVPDLVLRHVPGMTEADLSRLGKRWQSLSDEEELLSIRQRYQPLLDGERPLYRIRSSLTLANQLIMRREALVAQDSETGVIRVLFWRDNVERSPEGFP